MLMASAKKKALEYVPCIHYPVQFKGRNKNQVQALIDSDSEVNAMIPAYTSRLGLRDYRNDIGAQKIDGSTLETFGMVLASFQVEDKLGRAWFFQKTFLLADISAKIVLGIAFLTLSNVNVQFVKKELI